MYAINVYNKNGKLIYNKEFRDTNYLDRFKSFVQTFDDDYNEFYMKVYRDNEIMLDIFYRIYPSHNINIFEGEI